MPPAGLSVALTSRRVFDGEQFLPQHAVILEGDRIAAVVPAAELPSDLPRRDLGDTTLAPGFIDLQVNGGGGVMLNNAPTPDSVNRMTSGHLTTGTTGLLPTLISDTPEIHRAGVAAVVAARDAGNAGVLGVHIEGPFFDLSRRGTHRADMIRPLQEEDIDWLCQLPPLPVVLTLAPEHTRPGQIRRLVDAGIRVCAGHTDASYAQVQAAIAEGLSGFTHLFNAMSPLAAREPGAVGAALDSADTWVGIIADGQHVHPAALRIAQRSKPPGRLLLVSDAMATVGSDERSFDIYGERIEIRDGRLVNAEGVLAGSAIGMVDAVRISHQEAGLPLDECLRMASRYPAEYLHLDRELGRLAPGYRADLVSVDAQFRITDTWVAGRHTHHGGTLTGHRP